MYYMIGASVPSLHRESTDSLIVHVFSLTIAESDFGNLIPITFQNEADIRLFTTNDDTTLEYDDSVILTFTPGNPDVIDGLEGAGEYVRNSAIVNIIDNDSKCYKVCE